MHPEKSDGAELLSSSSTPFWKHGFPISWTLVVGGFAGALWFDLLGSPPAPGIVKGTILGAWALFSSLFFHWFGQLESLWLQGESLVVGDPVRGTRVSLRDVAEVKESRFQRLKTVTLELARPTPVGNRITFVPRGTKEFWLPWANSAVAAELREHIGRLADPGSRQALRDGEGVSEAATRP